MTFPEALQLLKQQSLPVLVQEELERMILEGRLLPGEPLREVALAALLGVSRGPIREAFRALEEKGLVRVVKNCGVHVRKLDLDEAAQLYEVRMALEKLIGEKVATAITQAGIDELREIVATLHDAVSAGDINRYTAFNFQFHERLAAMSGNRKLYESYNRLVAELSLFRRQAYLHDEHTMSASLDEHRAILDAVAERDPQRAAHLLSRHAAQSCQRLHAAQDALQHESPP
jgi:phosphonate utilization transcriptional regulator